MSKFTIQRDTRIDSNNRPIDGWLVTFDNPDALSCFFASYLILVDDMMVDHGFESACEFGRRYFVRGGF